jgi:hypothetical protein
MDYPPAMLFHATYVATGTEGTSANLVIAGPGGLTPTGGMPFDTKAITVSALNQSSVANVNTDTFLVFQDDIGNEILYYPFEQVLTSTAGTNAASVQTIYLNSGYLPKAVLVLNFSQQPAEGDRFEFNFLFHGSASPIPGSGSPDQTYDLAAYADFSNVSGTVTVSFVKPVPVDAKELYLTILNGTNAIISWATLVMQNDNVLPDNITIWSTEINYPTNAYIQAASGGNAGTGTFRIPLIQGVQPYLSINLSFAAAATGWVVCFASFKASGSAIASVAEVVTTPTVALHYQQTATGQGTGLPTLGMGVASVDLTITGTATVTWQAQGPNYNTYTVFARNRLTGVVSTTATTSGIYDILAHGTRQVYANITSYTSGQVTAIGSTQPMTGIADTLGILPSPGEVLVVGPNAAISVAPGITYNSPYMNLVGNRDFVTFTDVSGLSGTSATMILNTLIKTSLLTNQQYYTYATSGSSPIAFNPVLQNSGGGNSGIYTPLLMVQIVATSSNTTDFTINGIELGVR